MIKEEFITIKVINATKKYYTNLGYDTSNTHIDVLIKDLPHGSKLKLTTECDICKKEKNIVYRTYIKNINDNNSVYVCKKCSVIKTKKTNIERYGHENPMMSNIVKEQIKNNNIEKYGVDHPMKLDSVKNKMKNTMLEKYGHEHALQVDKFKNDVYNTMFEKYGSHSSSNKDVITKKEKTNIEKYGHKCSLNNEDVKQKSKKTNIEKYGYDHPMKSDIIKTKLKNTQYNLTIENYLEIFKNNKEYDFISYNKEEIQLRHKQCDNIFSLSTNNLTNRKNYIVEYCTICNPISKTTSNKENILKEFISSLDIEFIENDRTVLNGKELDIYIPKYNLAIEFNGLYWHSELYKDSKYHLNKTEICESKNIQLLHVFEDDWIYKQDIVKSIIRNKLGKIDDKIYARKCVVKDVSSKNARQFLDNNHIQGFSRSKYKLGLYYNNELVSLMTFGYRRTNTKKEFELIRFCNLINTNVIGASSKLFKYFINNYMIEEDYILSYADVSMFDGNMYKTIGFEYIHRSIPNYFWVVDSKREHRWKYNKQKLIKEGYNPDLTEVEIMHSRNYYRIYGVGQDRYEFKL